MEDKVYNRPKPEVLAMTDDRDEADQIIKDMDSDEVFLVESHFSSRRWLICTRALTDEQVDHIMDESPDPDLTED